MPFSFLPDARMRTVLIQAACKRHTIATALLLGSILFGLSSLIEILLHGTLYCCIFFLPVATVAVVAAWHDMSCLEIKELKNRLREQLALKEDSFVETFNSTSHSPKSRPGQCQRHVLFQDIESISWDSRHMRWVIQTKKIYELLFDAPDPGPGTHPFARVERKNRPIYIYGYYAAIGSFISELSERCGVPAKN